MLLKRHFANGADKAATHVEVKHSGRSPEQNFSDRLVDAAVKEGWMVVGEDTLTLKTEAEPLVFALKRKPGYFCKSTGEPIPVSEANWLRFRLANDQRASAEAKAWLAGKGLPANDYDITTAYHCVLNAKQHAKYRAVARGGLAPVADYKMEA